MSRKISFENIDGKIFIDDSAFDWELDDEAIDGANRHANNPEFMRAIHLDIMEHFLRSLAEVLGFRPSMKQVNEALRAGFISK
jgi:hypothetical protein